MTRSLRIRAVLALGFLAATCLAQTTVSAYTPDQRYVPSLKGTFAIFRQHIPGHGHVMGASAVELDRDSPMWAIFRTLPGEFITHLDGRPATSFRQLNSHIGRTTVRWVDPETGRVYTRQIYIR